jgi:hypothetical protein
MIYLIDHINFIGYNSIYGDYGYYGQFFNNLYIKFKDYLILVSVNTYLR